MSNLMSIITSISSYILIHIMSVVTHPAGTIFIDCTAPQKLPFTGHVGTVGAPQEGTCSNAMVNTVRADPKSMQARIATSLSSLFSLLDVLLCQR